MSLINDYASRSCKLIIIRMCRIFFQSSRVVEEKTATDHAPLQSAIFHDVFWGCMTPKGVTWLGTFLADNPLPNLGSVPTPQSGMEMGNEAISLPSH